MNHLEKFKLHFENAEKMARAYKNAQESIKQLTVALKTMLEFGAAVNDKAILRIQKSIQAEQKVLEELLALVDVNQEALNNAGIMETEKFATLLLNSDFVKSNLDLPHFSVFGFEKFGDEIRYKDRSENSIAALPRATGDEEFDMISAIMRGSWGTQFVDQKAGKVEDRHISSETPPQLKRVAFAAATDKGSLITIISDRAKSLKTPYPEEMRYTVMSSVGNFLPSARGVARVNELVPQFESTILDIWNENVIE